MTNLKEMEQFNDSNFENKPYIATEKAKRNDPCPCGSGKKFKKCHGVNVS